MIELDAITPRDQELIDRMVEGALRPAELRAAIERLDRLPDGWKRCAAAFLEAQFWHEAFRAVGDSGKNQPERLLASISGAPNRVSRSNPRWLRGALAAGIAAASFAMGWLGHAARPWTSSGSAPQISPTQLLVEKTNESQPQREPAGPPAGDASVSGRLAAAPPRANRPAPDPREVVRPVGRLRIGSESASAEVPILAGPGINTEWLKRQPPPVSEYGQVVLQRHGYQVDQRRRLITATLSDGRRIAVPVDQVLVRYTGKETL
jgi:hypothetical protein